jgi:hypothetical protein
MAVGIGGAAPRALANIFAGLALVALGAAHVWPAALAAVVLAGLTIPQAHGGTPAEEAALEAALAELDAAVAAGARDPANICAAHEIPDKPARQAAYGNPRSSNPARSFTLSKSPHGMRHVPYVTPRILRSSGMRACRSLRAEPAAGEQARGLGGGTRSRRLLR